MSAHGRLRVGFTGYYGMRNFGDDLFGAICCEAARRHWRADPQLAGPTIDGVAARYTIPRWFPAARYGAADVLGKASRFYSFARAVRESDVLVLGGGSVINSGESFRKPMMLAAQRRGKLQLAAVGVSIGPFDDSASEASAAAFLGDFAYVSVRDRRSYELADRMGLRQLIHEGRDLAGLLPLVTPLAHGRQTRTHESDRLRIGICLCNYAERGGYPSPDKQALMAALVAALGRLPAGRALHVDIFSLNEHDRHGDHALSQALQQRLQQAGISTELLRYRNQGPLAVVHAIGRCDAFVSARLHGAIVAYLQGVPFTIIDYHPKCKDFADDVGLGMDQRITAGHQDADACASAIAAMLAEHGMPAFPREDYVRQAGDIFDRAPWAAEARAQ